MEQPPVKETLALDTGSALLDGIIGQVARGGLGPLAQGQEERRGHDLAAYGTVAGKMTI